MEPTASASPTDDYWVTWERYFDLIERLAALVYVSGRPFDHIVAIARGGLRVGDILSRILNTPLAVMAATSYRGPGGRHQGNLLLGSSLAMSSPGLGHRVLLVDDLADSGTTLETATQWLLSHHGIDLEEIATAVIWLKASSRFRPNFYAEYLEHSPWIHQPFEKYETLTPQELAKRFDLH